ncbi:hypothetical protein GTA08_BOTSDO11483 [Neofusicoccum parvum]|uniref:Uncharacterized protein n=1 Tax=Neofusicoccum parvum TaxID=310453 RepID=A0ACB5RX38_9PEZI|nr:hypothetical protein GTA08_BOTSDO11483 [Neofusicoccum parvum]
MLDGTKGMVTDATETTPTDSQTLEKKRRVLEYKSLLTDVERYNHSGASKDLPQHEFATTDGDTEWVRERMKEKWAQRHETHAWQMYNTALEDGHQSTLGKGDIWGEAGMEEEQWKAKRKAAREANKSMWAECEVAVLDEWKKTLGHGDYKDQIQELKRLQILLDIQNAEIVSRATRPYYLASKANFRLENLVRVANDHLESLDKVEAVEDINDKSRKIMRRVHTRVGRLMAQDIQDKAAREEEIRNRLQHTAALDFMFDAWTDLDTMKRIANATRKNLEEMEADLECVSLAAMDTVSALKDARLAMAFPK